MMHLPKMIDALPQRAVISPEARQRWLDGIVRYHGDRAEWHVQRLQGFGGSEIGALLRHELNLSESGFGNAQRIIEQKLCRRLPERETHHMRRGNELEHLARLAFAYRYGAEQDQEALAAMAKPHQRPGYEWLVGNPDDILKIGGKRFLPDYKVPATYSEGIDYDYTAQLHHYALGAQLRHIPLDGLVLAKLDLAPELQESLMTKLRNAPLEEVRAVAKMIADTDVPGLRIVAHVVEQVRSLKADILDVGRTYWNDYVLAGQVPDMAPLPRIELNPAQLEDLGRYQQQYAIAHAGLGHLEDVKKDLSGKITKMLDGVDVSKYSLPVTVTNVSQKRTLDPDRIIAEARALGATEAELLAEPSTYNVPALLREIEALKGNPNAEHLFERTYSAEKAEGYLAAQGRDLKEFEKLSLSVGISRKGEAKAAIKEMKASAERIYGGWMAELCPATEAEFDAPEQLAALLDEQNDSFADLDAFLEHDTALQAQDAMPLPKPSAGPR